MNDQAFIQLEPIKPLRKGTEVKLKVKTDSPFTSATSSSSDKVEVSFTGQELTLAGKQAGTVTVTVANQSGASETFLATVVEDIRYVIVVHGIGEQRKNETVIDVVNRFAEARRGSDGTDKSDLLTLGRATGQTGKDKLVRECNYPPGKNPFKPWLEFNGIPQTAPDDSAKEFLKRHPFLGETSKSGANLRFVDLCWADIMQNDYKDVGQEIGPWAKGLLGRLILKDRSAEALGNSQAEVPKWILKILDLLVETLRLVSFAMTFRFKEMKELIFAKFLGDVQLYGEFVQTRGQAVRRFHRLMARLEEGHKKDMEENGLDPEAHRPRYAVLAHSLGTVMSMDALLYAHVDPKYKREEKSDHIPNFPFPGYYKKDDEKDPVKFWETKWIERVDTFITLGSPIDKFLVMWWINYKYLLEPKNWADAQWLKGKEFFREEKIRHFNYCDEQDPVGHELDVARSAPAFREVFDTQSDQVFNRYPIPGAAHNAYWSDFRLFRWILSMGIDQKENGEEKPRWFLKEVYQKVIRYNYKLIPYSVIAFDFFTLTLALYSTSYHATAIAALVFVGACLMGRKVLDLIIWWRQILRGKAQGRWEGQDQNDRIIESRNFRKFLNSYTTVFQWAAYLLTAVYFTGWGLGFRVGDSKLLAEQIGLLILVATIAVFIWQRFFDSRLNKKDKTDRKQEVDAPNEKYLIKISKVDRAVIVRITIPCFVIAIIGSIICGAAGFHLKEVWGHIFLNLASFAIVAAVVFAYIRERFLDVKKELKRMGLEKDSEPSERLPDVNFQIYARSP